MNLLRRTGQFCWKNRRWWMLPILIMMSVFVALILLGQSSAIAPFIYTVF